MVRLDGREREIGLVREFVERPERNGIPHSRSVPILVFTAERGSGKSALLSELSERLDQNVPHAVVDCETIDADSVGQTLRAVAFELNRKCGNYGRISFPRFVTAQVIIAQDLDLTDPARARAHAKETLKHRNIGKLRTFLANTTPDVLALLPLAQQLPGLTTAGRYVPDLIFNGLGSWRQGRRVVLGEGTAWFGHQDRGQQQDPVDVLVDLNRRAANKPVADDQHEVAELLWAAFLADLRYGFRKWSTTRTLNCVILLDNVDSPAGLAFLEGLMRARRQHDAHTEDDPDPLTVVATSRGALSARVTPVGETIPLTEHASYADYRVSNKGKLAQGCYPVQLRYLTEDEVGNMVAALRLQFGSNRRTTTAIHRLTQGHAGATRMILDAIFRHATDPVDLRNILDSPEPGGDLEDDPATVEQRILNMFLQGLPEKVIGDLVTCSAARDLEQGLILSAHSELLRASHGETTLVFAPELWPSTTGNAAMPPILRRLLLRKLAVRDSDQATWFEVHDWLRHSRMEVGDETGSLYHALALGQVEHVAKRLAELLPQRGVTNWLTMLKAISAAPNALEHRVSPLDQVSQLTNWAQPNEIPIAPLARLMTALWIDSDPLGDNHRKSMYLSISADYVNIAPHSSNGLAALLGEAETYKWKAGLIE